MTIEIAKTLSVVFFTLSAVSFVTAAIFFFLFKIPKIISVTTGKSAQKAIENIQAENARTGSVTRSNLRHRGGTGKMSKATRFQRPETGPLNHVAVIQPPPNEPAIPEDAQNTTRLTPQSTTSYPTDAQQSSGASAQQAVAAAQAGASPEYGDTSVLTPPENYGDTSVLGTPANYGDTSVLGTPANYGETSVLGAPANYGETSVLGAPASYAAVAEPQPVAPAFLFHIDVEISFAESKEIVK